MIKGVGPSEHRPGPSQNPLLRTQWLLEFAVMWTPNPATTQPNYVAAV